ncbi:MAG: BMP family lipoprotein [Candidatus Thorarchaeota archaeon]|jgi:basic membrane protein A
MEQKAVAAVLIVVIVAGVGAVIFLGPTLFPPAPKVALILGTGGRGDLSFNDGNYAGALRAKMELGWDFTVVEPTLITEFEGFLRDFSAAGTYEIIVCGSFDQDVALATVAAEYPEQNYAIIDGFVLAPNVRSIVYTENEGSALVGALAGLMTQTDNVGFIGGEDMWLIHRFAAGFVWGANYTNPGVGYDVQYTGSWVDTTIGQNLADAMHTADVDIIYAAAGRSGLGAWTATRNKITAETNSTPLWMIGVDSPQMWFGTASYDDPLTATGPTFALSSMLKRVDVGTFEVIKSAYDGEFENGTQVYNLANGGHDWEMNGLIPFSNETDAYTLVEYDTPLLNLPQSIIDQIEDLRDLIIAGTVTVPDTIYWT